VLSDQFDQHDDRIMTGANASRTLSGTLAGLPMQTRFGMARDMMPWILRLPTHSGAAFFQMFVATGW
jgi:hypothetical protein